MQEDIKRKGIISEIIKRLSSLEGHVRRILGTVNSNIGPTGPTGAPGATGPTGPAGATGPTGATGPGISTIFNRYADVGNITTGEDDLYSDFVPAGQLAADGDKIIAEYGLVTAASGTATRRIRLYFGLNSIFDTAAFVTAAASSISVRVFIIRSSATTVRYEVTVLVNGSSVVIPPVSVGSLTVTNANSNGLLITGEAAGVGAATNDIVAKLASGWYLSA